MIKFYFPIHLSLFICNSKKQFMYYSNNYTNLTVYCDTNSSRKNRLLSWLNLIKCTESIEITVSSDRKLNAVLTDNKETLLVTLCFGS